jgi:hypothetical protein
MRRRAFIKSGAISAPAAGAVSETLPPKGFIMTRLPTPPPQSPSAGRFWPEGARMVISVSMQMEASAQPLSGCGKSHAEN